MKTGKIVVGMTGASGAIYAVRFIAQASAIYKQIFLTYSPQALQALQVEMGFSGQESDLPSFLAPGYEERLKIMDRTDYFVPPASGSFRHDGMVVVPCSMGALGRIANGVSDDLMTRAADVCLKERRKLILVVRETPFNLIHLRNMVAAAEAGAQILPANPSFYHRPATIEDLVDTVVARILQNLGQEQNIVPEWGTT